RKQPFELLSGIRAVSTSSFHNLLLDEQGNVLVFGYNGHGQLGIGNTADQRRPVQVAEGVVAVAAGGYHSLILKTDGSVWVSGSNGSGQIGQGRGVQDVAQFQALALPR